MKTTTIRAAVLLSLFSMTVAISGCKRSEPEKGAVPAPQASAVPVTPTAPPEPVAQPAPAPAVTETPAPAAASPGAAASTVRASKGAATNRSRKQPILRAVRSASQPGFDRIAFEFDSAGLPAWRAEYVDRPVVNCGSGEPVRVAGDAWLQISFSGAQARSEKGESTAGARRRKLAQPIARELVRTCDFEGEITYVIGVARPNAYIPRIMSAPSRLVIDVAH